MHGHPAKTPVAGLIIILSAILASKVVARDGKRLIKRGAIITNHVGFPLQAMAMLIETFGYNEWLPNVAIASGI